MADALRAVLYSESLSDLPQGFFNVSGHVYNMFVSFLSFWFSSLQAISKNGFWFKIAAEAKFKPEASSVLRIKILAPTKILGQKTFLRWLVDIGS